MIASTRKMVEIKQILYSILDEEYYLCDMFKGMVDSGDMDLETLSGLRKIVNNPTLHQEEISILNKEDIMNNPYLKNIQIPNVSINNFSLTNHRIIRPGFITYNNERKRNLRTMRQINSYFVCNKTLYFPGLTENNSNTCWMTVEPFEINSFKKIIEESSGNILLIGCGLGYVAYMLSLKDDVESITIVDSNQDVLDLFSKYILPQFEHKNKIHTIKSDALEHLNNCDLKIFDYINVDIWYDVVDMIFPYLKCLEIEKNNPSIKFSYWLENELKETIQKSILMSICNFPNHGFLTDKIGEDLVRNTNITSYEDIYNLVDIKDLRTLLYQWYQHNIKLVQKFETIDINRINRIQESKNTSFTL